MVKKKGRVLLDGKKKESRPSWRTEKEKVKDFLFGGFFLACERG